MHTDIDLSEMQEVALAFEQSWLSGKRPAIEGLLPSRGSHRRLLLATLVATEVRLRRQSGESPALADYEERFPGMSAYLRLAFGQRSVPHLFPMEWMQWFLRF